MNHPSTVPLSPWRQGCAVALSPAEPFRLFFPLGLLLGLIGVVLWPLFQLKVIEFYPAVMHARLMIEGFMAAFIFGFLGTAGPRLLSAPHLTRWECGLFAGMMVLLSVLHLGSFHQWGDAVFLVLLVLYVGCLVRRFRCRKELPPPNFVLVLLGLLCGMVGTLLLLAAIPSLYSFAYLLLYQGFILLPVLGVGMFLFPKFLGLPVQPSLPDSAVIDAAWRRGALRAGIAGLIIIGTFALEAAGAMLPAYVIRFATALFLLPKGVFTSGSTPGTLTMALRLGILLMLAGLVLMVFLPGYRTAVFHILAIGGFSLIVFLVATRVMYGHSGLGGVLRQRTPFLIIATALVVIALAIRFAADFQPSLRWHLISTAAIFWIAGAVVWAVRTIPRIFVPDTE